MTEEDLKQEWQQSAVGCNAVDPRKREFIIEGRRVTALDRLARRYKRFVYMELICTLFLPVSNYFTLSETGGGWLPQALAAWMALFFLIAAAMDWILARKVESIDVLTMPANEVITRAMKCKELHIKCIFILLPFVALYLAGLVWLLLENLYLIIAVGVGLVVGLAIGLHELANFMNDYRLIRRQ